MINNSKRALAALLVLGLTAAACSDDKKDAATTTTAAATESTTASSEESTTTVADPLGEKNPATGDTIKVGYMWSGVSASVDNTSDKQAAESSVKWLNEYGGGIAGGHKLELVECAGSDAATAAACGSTMIESGVQVVLFNVIGDVEPWATPVLAAGIPIFAYNTADKSVMGAAGHVFTLTNPTAGLGLFPATLALKVKASRSAVVVIDVPAASGPVQALVPPTFKALNAGPVDLVPISPTAADHSSAIQTELQNKPDNIHIIGNPAFCTLTIRALRDADYKGAISIISNCIDADMRKQLSNGELKDVYVSYGAGEDPANKDYQTFVAALAKYSPDTAPHGTAVGAWVAILGFQRIMDDFTGDFTSANITTHIVGHAAVKLPNIDDATFKCDGKAVPGIGISCTSAFAYTQLDEKGDPTVFTKGG